MTDFINDDPVSTNYVFLPGRYFINQAPVFPAGNVRP